MKLDLTRSPEDLAIEVGSLCAPLGLVTKVTVYPGRAGQPARPFAIVSMATPEATEAVAAALAGRVVGTSAIVFLDRPAAPAYPRMTVGVRPMPGKVFLVGGSGRK